MKVKNNKEKKLNPFELHINSKKFTILGRKSKNEVGKPGISRSKSIQKRKKKRYCLSTNLKTNQINLWIVELVKKIVL